MAQGSITKHVAADRTVSWRVRVDMGEVWVTDPKTGKQKLTRKRPMRTFRTKKEAEEAVAKSRVARENGTAVDHSRMTTGEYLLHWLETGAKPRVRQTTYAGYERLIRVNLIPRIGATPLQKLTALHIQESYADMRTAARADNEGWGAVST